MIKPTNLVLVGDKERLNDPFHGDKQTLKRTRLPKPVTFRDAHEPCDASKMGL